MTFLHLAFCPWMFHCLLVYSLWALEENLYPTVVWKLYKSYLCWKNMLYACPWNKYLTLHRNVHATHHLILSNYYRELAAHHKYKWWLTASLSEYEVHPGMVGTLMNSRGAHESLASWESEPASPDPQFLKRSWKSRLHTGTLMITQGNTV